MSKIEKFSIKCTLNDYYSNYMSFYINRYYILYLYYYYKKKYNHNYFFNKILSVISFFKKSDNIFFYLLSFLKNLTCRVPSTLTLVSSNTYLFDISNNIIEKDLTLFNVKSFGTINVYFFWYFFNQDKLINLFINLTMKHGKKYLSYKNVYNCFFFLKKSIGIQPVALLKKLFYKYRFLFDINNLVLKKKIIIRPKLLSYKSQLTKSLKYLFNSFYFKNFKVKKKSIPFFKKLSYIILNSIFNRNKLRLLIKEDYSIVRKNFINVEKEEYFLKYVQKLNNTKKKKLFKIKWKSINKKMKYIRKEQYRFKKLKEDIEFKKFFLLNRYNINLQGKKKLKSKWF